MFWDIESKDVFLLLARCLSMASRWALRALLAKRLMQSIVQRKGTMQRMNECPVTPPKKKKEQNSIPEISPWYSLPKEQYRYP